MDYDIPQYLKHKVTAYHFRYNQKNKHSCLVVCSCGWKDKIFRSSFKLKLKEYRCFFFGHKWGKDYLKWSVGPAGFEENDADAFGRYKQCSYCYKCNNIDASVSQLAEEPDSSPGQCEFESHR